MLYRRDCRCRKSRNIMDLTWLGAILVGAAGCLALGYCLGARCPVHFLSPKRPTKDTVVNKDILNKKPALQIEKLADILKDFKMVLVVRNDLKMGKGKIAAQCSHATLGLYKKLVNCAPKALSSMFNVLNLVLATYRWERCGQVKVVVKTESEEEMLFLQERANSAELLTHITIDAGRTQIAPNSRTVMAIMGPADMVDDVTGDSGLSWVAPNGEKNVDASKLHHCKI
ncbi:hypothetical protein V2J09_014147 [Rumex salicifolius]